jgi:hypothetical protein
MDLVKIACTLLHVKSFLGVYTSDQLPYVTAQPNSLIVNSDPTTKHGSHWLAIRFEPRSSTAYYFDSYGLAPFVNDIQSFLHRNCSVLQYNNIQHQGLASTYVDGIVVFLSYILIEASRRNNVSGCWTTTAQMCRADRCLPGNSALYETCREAVSAAGGLYKKGEYVFWWFSYDVLCGYE